MLLKSLQSYVLFFRTCIKTSENLAAKEEGKGRWETQRYETASSTRTTTWTT